VLDLDGNAVLGYMLCFDVEGDSGIVARAYGTACSIHHLKATHTQRLNLDLGRHIYVHIIHVYIN
jgi:hypothetical protein